MPGPLLVIGSCALFFPTKVALDESWQVSIRSATIESHRRASDAPPKTSLPERLKEISVQTAKSYGCKVAIGVQGSSLAMAVSSDGDDDAKFVWGSCAKMMTGAGILRAVERGQLDLDKPVAPVLDPVLDRLGLGSMRALFGPLARFITTRHLATMSSGVPDYDTANPFPKPPMDAFRAEVYRRPRHEFTPAELLNVSWVAMGKLDFVPGWSKDYSSTNFVLLGLLLSAVHGYSHWDQYRQVEALDALPPSRRALYASMRFAAHGSPANWTSVHGFDRTSYNGANASDRPGRDVFTVSGVYGGWTASDMTASAADTARFGYDLYGKRGPRILTAPSMEIMVPTSPFYGFATFNLSSHDGWGPSSASPYARAYGHLGATYGYQSIVAYFPGADVSISVGTDIETDGQTQPSAALCLAYNAVLAYLTGTAEPQCTYKPSGYYGGSCDCGNDYSCHPLRKRCERSAKGSLSFHDCSQAC